MENLEK